MNAPPLPRRPRLALFHTAMGGTGRWPDEMGAGLRWVGSSDLSATTSRSERRVAARQRRVACATPSRCEISGLGLTFAGLLTVLFALAACTGRPVASANSATNGLERFEFTEPHMGVPFRLVFYASDAATAETAARAAFARVKELNDIMSDYDAESELSRLSRTVGEAVKVSDDLWIVLRRSQALAGRTHGAFDVTVGPYVNLWRRARRQQQLPNPKLLAEAKARVGYRHLRLEARARTAKLLVPDMRLDLGAIAKGYAVDAALEVLRNHGCRRALVAGAGDLAAGDPPPGKKGWRVEVAPLDVPNAPPARFVSLANAALATSGDLFQRLEIDGKRYSHIVDPRTGLGLTDHSLVTVIARDCTTADSLATAVSVLGPDAGMKLIERTRGAEVHIVRRPGEGIEQRESRGFRRYYEPAGERASDAPVR